MLKYVFLSALFLLLRFQNLPGVITENGIVINDTDPYYRLHRIQSLVTKDWAYPLHDPVLSYPTGFDVPWPLGLEYIIAVPLRIFHVTNPTTIEIFAAAAIPFLALPSLWLLFSLASSVFSAGVGWICAFLFITSPNNIYVAGFGTIDHHFLEALIPLLALFLLARWRESPKSSRETLLSLTLGFSSAFWPHAWIVSLMALLSFLADPNPIGRRRAPAIFLKAFLFSLLPLAASSRFFSLMASPLSFSWWAPLMCLFLCGFFFLLEQRKSYRQLPLAIVLLAFAVFVGSKAGSYWDILTARSGILAVTKEASSPFLISIGDWPVMGMLSLFLAWAWFPLQALNKNRWWLVGFVLIPLSLAMAQLRFLSLATPFLILCTAALFWDLALKIFRHPWSFRFGLFALTSILIIPTLPKWAWIRVGNTHPYFASIQDAAQFLGTEVTRLQLKKEDRSILGHWDYGHWLVYRLDSPVVNHPFHPPSVYETLRLFTSTGLDEFEAFTNEHPFRYMVIEMPSGRFRRWIQMVGKDPNLYFESVGVVQSFQSFRALPPFYDLMLPRFFEKAGEDSSGRFPMNWRLVFESSLPSPYDPTKPALKIYERIKGAVVTLQSRQKKLWLTATIKTGSSSFEFRRLSESENGNHRWSVPYSAVNHGGVSFSGIYSVSNEKKTMLIRTPVVNEFAVFEGKVIALPKIP